MPAPLSSPCGSERAPMTKPLDREARSVPPSSAGAHARRLLLAALAAAAPLAGCGEGDFPPAVEVSARPRELANWSLLKSTYRVAVILYDFNNTPPNANPPNQNAAVNRLSVNDVVNLSFSRTPAQLD